MKAQWKQRINGPIVFILFITCIAIAGVLIYNLLTDIGQRDKADVRRHLWTDAEMGRLRGLTEDEVRTRLGEDYVVRITISRYCPAAYLWHYAHIFKKEMGWVNEVWMDVVYCDRKVAEVRTGYEN